MNYCVSPGCDNPRTNKNLCGKHLRYYVAEHGDSKCCVDFCPFISFTEGHCKSHYDQLTYCREVCKEFIPRGICAFDGCGHICNRYGNMCSEHHNSHRESVVFTSKARLTKQCTSEACLRKAESLGLCSLHYGQLPHRKVAQQKRNAEPKNVSARAACFKKWREAKRGDKNYCAKRMLSRSKKRALENGVEFSLTLEDIIIPDVCPLLEQPLDIGASKAHDWSPSIDRIDSSKGYIPGNVWVVSWRANRIKNDATFQELELLLANLKLHTNGKF
jgi:hypothetical protein